MSQLGWCQLHRLLDLPRELGAERFDCLVERPGLRIERIVSPPGHQTAPGYWYDQDRDEWVTLLAGRAAIEREGDPDWIWLDPGDSLLIPAGCRHRVAATDERDTTVWLAVHYD